MNAHSRRRRAQAGTTLVELLVATVLMGLALAILIGLFSTGAVDSLLASRDGAAQAAAEYELEKIAAAHFDASPASYSDCFASAGSTDPVGVAYQGGCPSAARVRADVSAAQVPCNSQTSETCQQWTIALNSWPAAAPIGKPVSTYKANR
jgi:type II secretory pathway pseudopilin PulG